MENKDHEPNQTRTRKLDANLSRCLSWIFPSETKGALDLLEYVLAILMRLKNERKRQILGGCGFKSDILKPQRKCVKILWWAKSARRIRGAVAQPIQQTVPLLYDTDIFVIIGLPWVP